MHDSSREILVLGDDMLDWHLVQTTKPGPACWYRHGGMLAALPGGASLLSFLVEACLEYRIVSHARQDGDHVARNVGTVDTNISQTMALTTLFTREPRSKATVLRIQSLCGVAKRTGSLISVGGGLGKTPFAAVIDDAGMAIREDSTAVAKTVDALSAMASRGKPPWIILKIAWPVLASPMLKALVDKCSEKLIVVVPIEDLRRDSIQVSRGLSWEQTAQDLSWEFNYNPRLKPLGRICSLVVPLGLEGVWFSHAQSTESSDPCDVSHSTLVYDPGEIEGSWEKDRPGMCLGYTSCLTVGLLAGLSNPDQPCIVQGVRCGLSSMRELHSAGYDIDSITGRIMLPTEAIRSAIKTPCDFPALRVPLGHRHYSVPLESKVTFYEPERWSILKEKACSGADLFNLATRIVRYGAANSLGPIPHAKFGGLLTVDRNEIEAFRATYDLMHDYCASPSLHRPLSLAVFGPPGSGKSYGVEQIAKAVAGDAVEKMTFNVSQFADLSDLVDAFHRVRDAGLRGKLPLVFWDEFDSSLGATPLYWLKSFLAPMQDGEFTQGQITHPIGRAIFVFAGGTATSVDELGAELLPAEMRSAKVPDFTSRLRGCVNIVGIDRVCHRGRNAAALPDSDAQYVVRRAVILRTIIERARLDVITDGVANIDPGLLKALLCVWSFKHGVRSLESIVQLCHMGDPGVLHRSSLPPPDVLALHVDPWHFLGLVTADVEFEGPSLETLAAAHHELYRETSPNARLARLDYKDLNQQDKEKNRDAVRGIPYKLAAIGFTYQATSDADAVVCEQIEEEEAERLARLEHDRWILSTIDSGYAYGKERSDAAGNKTHPDLVPWDEIDSETAATIYPKQVAAKLGPGPLRNSVDLDMARNITEIMRRAGYSVRRFGA